MISMFDNVKISYILHKIIYKAEKDLKAVTKLPSFFQKSLFIKTLVLARIRFARFLVVYRWLKLNPQTNKANSKSDIYIWEKYGTNILNQLKKIHIQAQKNLRQNLLNKSINFNNLINNKYNQIHLLAKGNKQKDMFHIMCKFLENYETIKHIQGIHVINKYIIINAHPHYLLTLKVNTKKCYAVRLKLYWDRNFNFPPDYLKELIEQLQPFDLERPNELYRIDSFLFSFHTISFFGKIVQQLKEHADSFKCQILREINNSISIIFTDFFEPFNRFILKINLASIRIEISSEAPLFHPPKDLRTINEIFEKLDTDTKYSMTVYNRAIDITEDFNGLELLSEIRDLVFYTNVQRFWIYIKRALRSSLFPQFKLTMKCDTESIFSISIRFYDGVKLLLTIIFQSTIGRPIFIPISSYYNIDRKPSLSDTAEIFNSMFLHYIEHLDFFHFFKPHIFSLMRKFTLSDSIIKKFTFSFSDHFYIEKYNRVEYPSLELRSIDNPENLNPRSDLIKHFIRSCVTITDFDALVINISLSSKILIILLEFERRLKLRGMLTKRKANAVYVPIIGCKFKIDINECWSITFEKAFMQSVSNGRVIIRGNKLSLRFVDSIIKMIEDCFKLAGLIYTARHNLTYSDDRKIYLKTFGYHFCIIYEPFYYDYYMKGHLFHYCTVFPFRYPYIHMRIMMYSPFSNFAHYLETEDEISSYLNRTIYYQLHISNVFNSRDWKVVPFNNKDSFSIIYLNKLSMVVHKRNDPHLVASVFMIGPSSLLLVPLNHLFELIENKVPVVSFKIDISDFEKIKTEIEKFDDLIKAFELMKIDHLFYNQGKVVGKGTRFYLVQAALDVKGIIISSPSFPSLIKITTSIYNLDINFESKKKIYNFIFSMLLFNDRYIVNMLNTLKEIINPYRIMKLNWEEMSNYMKININDYTMNFLIIEGQKKVRLIFDDPVNQTIIVNKDGKEKRFLAKEFDEIYLQLNPELSIYDQFVF